MTKPFDPFTAGATAAELLRKLHFTGHSEDVESLVSEVRHARGLVNVLADELAKYNGTTVPGTIRWAEAQVRKGEQ